MLVKILRLILVCVQVWPDHDFVTIVLICGCVVVFLVVCELFVEDGLEVAIGSFCDLLLHDLDEFFYLGVELGIPLVSQLKGRAYKRQVVVFIVLTFVIVTDGWFTD